MLRRKHIPTPKLPRNSGPSSLKIDAQLRRWEKICVLENMALLNLKYAMNDQENMDSTWKQEVKQVKATVESINQLCDNNTDNQQFFILLMKITTSIQGIKYFIDALHEKDLARAEHFKQNWNKKLIHDEKAKDHLGKAWKCHPKDHWHYLVVGIAYARALYQLSLTFIRLENLEKSLEFYNAALIVINRVIMRGIENDVGLYTRDAFTLKKSMTSGMDSINIHLEEKLKDKMNARVLREIMLTDIDESRFRNAHSIFKLPLNKRRGHTIDNADLSRLSTYARTK